MCRISGINDFNNPDKSAILAERFGKNENVVDVLMRCTRYHDGPCPSTEDILAVRDHLYSAKFWKWVTDVVTYRRNCAAKMLPFKSS